MPHEKKNGGYQRSAAYASARLLRGKNFPAASKEARAWTTECQAKRTGKLKRRRKSGALVNLGAAVQNSVNTTMVNAWQPHPSCNILVAGAAPWNQAPSGRVTGTNVIVTLVPR